MAADNNSPDRSNLSNRREGRQGDPAFMAGPSMFEEFDDDYLDPGDEAPEAIEAMDSMMDQYLDALSGDVSQGQLTEVPVVGIKKDHVLVDVGEKSEGMIDIRDFPMIDGKPQVKVGDVIEAVVRGFDHESGLITLSHAEARRRKAFVAVREALESKAPVKGIVTRTVKGGLILDIGTTAFLPASQIDLRRVDNFDEWIGREVEGIVIEFVPEKRRIIVSRRRLLEDRRESERKERLTRLDLGAVLNVTVKRLVDFGAFVELGGVDGLIPRSEISWQRNGKPEDFLTEGEELQAKVIEINPESGKITLSRRQVLGDPWENAPDKYTIGSTISGSIVSLTNYGAFVRIAEGLDGMIHVSDMSWDSAMRRPADFVAPGQEVTASVLGVDSENRRISLGLKQLTKDPWEDVATKYPKGTKIAGKVSGLTKYGAFVELEPGIEGMVHVSDFSWEKRISKPRDVVKRGDDVEAVVLEIDPARRRISLGVKQLSENPWQQLARDYKIGETVEGPVLSVNEFGVVVKIGDNAEGFMHVSQMDAERVDTPAALMKVGDTVSAKITRIDPETGKISLSRKQMLKDEEKSTIKQYMKRKESGSINSLGELFGDIVLEDVVPPQQAQEREQAAPSHPVPGLTAEPNQPEA